MKEIRDIISSYNTCVAEGKKCALATVVHIEGSSYRRPGARMLISEDGQLTGAISGGCLEGDAMRKALLVINEQIPTLVTYDTMDEDDAIIGIGLGCNGIIDILIEPIQSGQADNPIQILKAITNYRQHAVIVTLFSWDMRKLIHAGTRYYLNQKGDFIGNSHYSEMETTLKNHAAKLSSKDKSDWVNFKYNGEKMSVFFEIVLPPIHLVSIGAGNDVIPLVEMSGILGWETTIIDGRAGYARKERFPDACSVMVATPKEVLNLISIDKYTCFTLMTHNYNYDKALLYELTGNNAEYIALLGPKSKLERILSEYEDEGRRLTSAQIDSIYCPAGLDIGAETSEEIALSVISEIKAVMNRKKCNHLRHKSEGIHAF
ncbi:MAG: XdhC family protein [Saprospiraceae bacterium]|jgi:xanthine/CO dehydrogenase XdhC/CoxF family maturation factor|nr:XdhC family protein [Saprospiraceae bacterium]